MVAKRKCKQDEEKLLGMPYGTAAHRLRKAILFKILKRLGENFCFRCGEEILVPNDLGIDHKLPWRRVSPELFWDLENIAFSHTRCNTADRPNRSGGCEAEAPAGQSWCNTCKQFLPFHQFRKSSNRWNGVDYRCKHCRSVEPIENRRKKFCIDCGVMRGAVPFYATRNLCKTCRRRRVNRRYAARIAAGYLRPQKPFVPKKVRLGSERPHAKLTESIVTEIRRLHRDENVTTRRLAEQFGVSSPLIVGIVNRKKWKHVE